jgi:hypothetical protein
MDTLYSISLNPTVNTRKSDRLYFNKYQYCLSFRLDRATCLRNLGKDHVISVSDHVTERFMMQNPYSWQVVNRTPHRDDISEQAFRQRILDDLIVVARALEPCLEIMRLAVSGNHVYLYSNNLDTLQELLTISLFTQNAKLCQVEINRPANTVMLRKSLYLKRSYFREQWINTKHKEALKNFLTRQDDIRIGPGLNSCLHNINNISYRGETLMQRYFFFDHNSDSTSVMLELIAPGTIRRTVPVLTK